MKFCTKCGTKIEDEGNICPNCGYDSISKSYVNSETTADNDDMDQTSSLDTERIRSLFTDLKSRRIIIGVIALVVFTTGFVFLGRFLSNPFRCVSKFQNAVNSNDIQALSGVMYTSDSRLKMTEENLKPVVKSFKTTPSEFTDIMNNLNTEALSIRNGGIVNKKSSLYIKKVGNIMLFFPKYKVTFNPVFLTVTSTVKGADILINDKKQLQTDSSSFSKQFGPYVPGTYKIEGRANGAFGQMDNTVNVDFIKNGIPSTKVNVLNGIYLDVNSKYTKNEVYINGRDTGKSVNSGDRIGPIASGADIYAVMNYNGEKIKSSVSKLSDSDTSVYFDYEEDGEDPEEKKNEISAMIVGYASSLANTLTYGDKSQLVNYMYPGSKFYTQQMDRIDKYYGQDSHFYEKYDSAVVNSYKMNPDGKSGTVYATEVYEINEDYSEMDSKPNTKTFHTAYKFQYNDTIKTYQLTERMESSAK